MSGSPSKRPEGYEDLLRDLKDRVRAARVQAVLAVNRELVLLYWSIGRDILERQDRLGWGAKVIDQLATDLQKEFPESKGFSSRNLKYMRSLAREWPEGSVGQQLAAQLPWFHTCTLLEKVEDPEKRLWYARKTLENGWSRNALVIHVERELFEAQGGARTNFATTLPAPQSDLAREALKDPYKLDFLGIAEDAEERVIEVGLVRHIRDFLLELGQGFAFVGNQCNCPRAQSTARIRSECTLHTASGVSSWWPLPERPKCVWRFWCVPMVGVAHERLEGRSNVDSSP